MPTVLKIGPYRFFFFSKENNEPAHIHISAGDREAKIWLTSLTLAYSYGFKPHEMAQLIAMVREHQTTFQEAWNEHFKRTA